MALVTLLAFLPSLLLSVPAGVLADRYDRRILMVLGDSLSAAGGNRKQGAVVTLLPAVLDRFTRRLLIRSQFHIRMLPA